MRRVKKEVTDFITLCEELLLHDQAVVCEEVGVTQPCVIPLSGACCTVGQYVCGAVEHCGCVCGIISYLC